MDDHEGGGLLELTATNYSLLIDPTATAERAV